MNTETFAKTAFGRVFVKILASGMESRFRYRFFSPMKILKGADILPGQNVLEIGCGTGFFTIPAARLIGDSGILTAIDILQESVDLVSVKVKKANLKNVIVKKGNAADTGFDGGTFNTVLLFGIIPAPMLPLNSFLPELHRILKPEGNLAVWPPIPGWLPKSILKSGLFNLANKRNSVYNFQRC
jgi:demethylmenaquinone methyltransferase/2-methoxy-6-polyprenyl-1,4-benzoquinol methylase